MSLPQHMVKSQGAVNRQYLKLLLATTIVKQKTERCRNIFYLHFEACNPARELYNISQYLFLKLKNSYVKNSEVCA